MGKLDACFALSSVLILFAGFALGRILSIAVDGIPVGLYLGVLSAEVFFAICAALALKRL